MVDAVTADAFLSGNDPRDGVTSGGVFYYTSDGDRLLARRAMAPRAAPGQGGDTLDELAFVTRRVDYPAEVYFSPNGLDAGFATRDGGTTWRHVPMAGSNVWMAVSGGRVQALTASCGPFEPRVDWHLETATGAAGWTVHRTEPPGHAELTMTVGDGTTWLYTDNVQDVEISTFWPGGRQSAWFRPAGLSGRCERVRRTFPSWRVSAKDLAVVGRR